MWLILVILHCLLCLTAYILMRLKILKSTPMILIPAFFIPVFGFCCLGVLEWTTRLHPEARKEVGIEKLKINDEIHRSILMEEEPAQNLMVPLQEALLMNDANTRRELIMDILYHDTGEYVEVLQKARYNDDVEVVHYATTAMVELQKDYEEELARRKSAWEEKRDSKQRLAAYAEILESYVESGLLEGNIKRSRQEELCGLQERQLEEIRGSKAEEPERYRKWFQNLISLKKLAEAEKCAAYVSEQWPDMEDGHMMELHLAVEKRDGSRIRQVIERIERQNLYLSMEARKTVEFWKGNNEEQRETASSR